jgi:hypothetical protein
MLPFVSIDLYQGPVARSLHGADLSMPVGLVVAGESLGVRVLSAVETRERLGLRPR